MTAGMLLDDKRTCMLCAKYCSLYPCAHVIPDMVEVHTCEAMLYMCDFICAIW